MPGKIALEVGMDNRIALRAAGVGRVDSLHAYIEADDDEAHVEAHAGSIGYSNLAPEVVGEELPARLVVVVVDGPDVAGIDKEGAVEFPEEVGTILNAAEEAYVARLVDVVDGAVASDVAAWAETAQRPSAHVVGASGIVTFLEGEHTGIPVGESDTCREVGHEAAASVEVEVGCPADVALDVLRIGYAAHAILPEGVLRSMGKTGKAIEQIAGCLNAGTQRIVGKESAAVHHRRHGAIVERVARAHDEEVLVVELKDGVAAVVLVQVVVNEKLILDGHRNEVDAYQVVAMLHVARAVPKVAPSSRKHTTGEFGAVLRVPAEVELRGSAAAGLKALGDEGQDELREVEAHVGTIFDVMVSGIVLQLSDGFVGATKLEGKLLRTVKEVAVGKRKGRRCAQIASRIRAVEFKTYGHTLGRRHRDEARERAVGCLRKTDVGVLHGAEAGERAVCSLHALGIVYLPWTDEGMAFQQVRAQEGIVAHLVADAIDGVAMEAAPDHHRKVNLRALTCGISQESDVVLLEGVEALIVEVLRDAEAFVVKHRGVERHVTMK